MDRDRTRGNRLVEIGNAIRSDRVIRTPSMPEIVVRDSQLDATLPVLSASCHSAQETFDDDYHFILVGQGMSDPMRVLCER